MSRFGGGGGGGGKAKDGFDIVATGAGAGVVQQSCCYKWHRSECGTWIEVL